MTVVGEAGEHFRNFNVKRIWNLISSLPFDDGMQWSMESDRPRLYLTDRHFNEILNKLLVKSQRTLFGTLVRITNLWEFYHYLRRCPWCSRYRRRKRTRRHEFKSWTRLIAFHKALIPLGKVWIQLFSLQLRVNSRTD